MHQAEEKPRKITPNRACLCQDMWSLTSVTIPSSVTSIEMSAFTACTSLVNVTIGDSVKTIEIAAFPGCTSLTSVTIPSSVTSIGSDTFQGCTSLTGVYFQGNAPSIGTSLFDGDNNATIYYLPGTTGWGPEFQGGRPIVLWNPQAQVAGVRTNRFGFTISGTAGIPIVVEACTNLASASWISLQSCTITNGSIYFSDPQWTNYPRRFYRMRSP
jgi:hypothetical protein